MTDPTPERPSVKLRANAAKVRDVFDSYGVTNVRVFGSVARGDDHPGSDVDFLIEVPAMFGFIEYGNLIADLEELLVSHVDVVGLNTFGPVANRAKTTAIPLGEVLDR